MISMQNIRVDYADVTAVKDLTLDIGPGVVFGLIGPNGAGKSSTIRVLATLQEPTYGRVWIDGLDTADHPAKVRRVIGYMPDLAPVYGDLRCWEFLDLFAGAYFVDRRARARRVAECLDEVGLTDKRDAMAGTLSRGMTQRLVLAKTILPKPKVLLLDEPASGLDPIARVQMRDLLRRIADEGATVLVSSHILTELSEFCTSVGIMQKGEMILSGRMDEIDQQLGMNSTWSVTLAGPAGDVALPAHPNLLSSKPTDTGFELDIHGGAHEAAGVLRAIIDSGLPVCGFQENKLGMEEIMLEIGAKEVS